MLFHGVCSPAGDQHVRDLFGHAYWNCGNLRDLESEWVFTGQVLVALVDADVVWGRHRVPFNEAPELPVGAGSGAHGQVQRVGAMLVMANAVKVRSVMSLTGPSPSTVVSRPRSSYSETTAFVCSW